MISLPDDFRQATLEDAQAIAALKQVVWSNASTDVATILNALQTPTHHTHLAIADGQIAGFVSCFMTESAQGKKRWEIDLLAVHPDFRRRGLATKLVEEAVLIGERELYDFARALIQVDNVKSQRTFAENKFITDGQIQTLFVSAKTLSSKQNVASKAVHAHLVVVNTLDYRGVWLEEPLSTEAFAKARITCHEKNSSLVGAIIADDDSETCNYAQANQYNPVGKFHRWARKL